MIDELVILAFVGVPIGIMYAMAAMSAISTGLSIYGAIAQAKSQEEQADYNAKVAENNAATAAQQAEFDAQQIRQSNRRMLATQRQGFAASGVDPDAGTAIDVQRDTAIQGELEALSTIYAGRTTSSAYRSKADLYRAEGSYAHGTGMLNVGQSVLGGATDIAMIATNPRFK